METIEQQTPFTVEEQEVIDLLKQAYEKMSSIDHYRNVTVSSRDAFNQGMHQCISQVYLVAFVRKNQEFFKI